MKRVYRAQSLLKVAHARNLLISAGIECELRNVHLAGAAGELPLLETWPELCVADDDEQPALRALARAHSTQSGPAWRCETCGEQLEPQFSACWRCGGERDAAL